MQGNNGNGVNLHGVSCHTSCHDMDQASLAYHHTLAMHLMHSMGNIHGAHSPAGGCCSGSRGCHSGMDAVHAAHGVNVSGGCHSGMDAAHAAHGADIHAAHGVNVSGGCHSGLDAAHAAHGADIHAAHGVNASVDQGCQVDTDGDDNDAPAEERAGEDDGNDCQE